MPDILRLRYVGPATAQIPVLGRDVEPDCIVEVPGRIVTHDPDGEELIHPGDCFLAEVAGQVRAWPLSMWKNETPDAPAKPGKES